MSEKLISVTECAKKKGISRQSVNHAISRGALPAEKVGNSYVIKKEDCEAYEPAREPVDRANRRWGKEKGTGTG